jgi:hypothetical protein
MNPDKVLSCKDYDVYPIMVISPTFRAFVFSKKLQKGFCFQHIPGKNCENLKESISELFGGIDNEKIRKEISLEFKKLEGNERKNG